MCSGTLGHIARYHSKTSNNNKTLIVELLHMTLSYWVYITCHALLFSTTSLSPFMILSLLAIFYFLLYVLTLWICIFRFRGLGRSGAFHRGPGLSLRAGWPALVPSCPTLPFGSRDLHPFRERFCIFGCILFFWTWVVIKDTCKVILLIITCITLYLYFVSWHMIIPRCVLYSDTCCT